jgi:hypothetical protein
MAGIAAGDLLRIEDGVEPRNVEPSHGFFRAALS